MGIFKGNCLTGYKATKICSRFRENFALFHEMSEIELEMSEIKLEMSEI